MAAKDQHAVNVSELTFETIDKVRRELKRLIELGGSDLHIKSNSTMRARINGEIVSFGDEIFSKSDGITFAKELLRTRFSEFVEKKEMDLVYIYDESLRFRVNIFFRWMEFRPSFGRFLVLKRHSKRWACPKDCAKSSEWIEA